MHGNHAGIYRDSGAGATTHSMPSTRNQIPANQVIALSPCPAAGGGVHSWLLSAANRCRTAGLSEANTERILAERITRPPSPPNEIHSAVRKAYSSTTRKGTAHSTFPSAARRAPRPLSEIEYDPAKLAAIASKIKAPPNWRHWLWERSLKRPETQNALSFLSHLYLDGERVHMFDSMDGAGGFTPHHTVTISHPMDCRVPCHIKNGGTGAGIWYLCNPVDGEWHPNPRTGTTSCRSEESITAFRYGVLESDQAPASHWFAFLSQLPIRIAAIYTSGSRSIHALVRIDAKTKGEWDEIITRWKRPFKALGGDAGCLSAVRLTRLPDCKRPDKGGFQRLLYLCPDPPEARLIDLPVRWNRAESLARWKDICRRWKKEVEAFQ